MAKQSVNIVIVDAGKTYLRDEGLYIDDSDGEDIFSDSPIDSNSEWIPNMEAVSFNDKAGFFSTSIEDLVKKYDSVTITKVF